jgi:hypothetical protein
MVVYPTGTFEIKERRSMAEDDYADALLHYWAAVKEAERTIAPFFHDGSPLSPQQREVIAGVVARVSAAEDVYFAALEAAGQSVPYRPSSN